MKIRFIVCIVSILLYVFPLASAMSNSLDFGTQFGASYTDYPEDALRSFNLPSSVPSLGTSLPSFYLTWYPNEYIGMTPEASWGFSSDTGYTGHFGFRLSGLLRGYTSSTPYAVADVSVYGIDLPEHGRTRLLSFGGGLGYHFNAYSKFICRIEAQFKRLIGDDGREGNKFSLVVSIGTLFSLD